MSVTTENIRATRLYLKNKILREINFNGYDKETKQITDLIKRTVEIGESNSALLIGPRGVGKTSLVNHALAELENNGDFHSNAIIVRLHGLIHMDDRLALKSATSQMDLDNSVDGKVFGSFAENLAFLLACLKTGQRETSKSIIFVLEEFDLFCAHHNQTLLYNLFDVSQSAQTPLCIIGLTCRLDVIELLEKRVKSRFSHRQIFLFPDQDENASNLDTILTKIRNLLSFTSDSQSNFNLPATYKKDWNKHVKILIDDKKFKSLIQKLLDIDLNEHTLRNILVLVVSTLSEEKRLLKLEDFQEQMIILERDEMLDALLDLSVLEMCLLIAMKHHCEIYDNQPMNFEMIFTRYVKFASANSNVQNVQRPVLMKAFEHIQSMELVCPVLLTSGRLQKEYQMFKLAVTPQQILEAVKKSQGMPTEIVQWANSSLV